MNLTLRQLRAFVAVADAGSFTEASRQLHLTQSALSVLVREMERELGVRLFDRSTRRVSLTEAGAELQPAVRRMLADLAGAVANVSGLRDKRRGVLRLAAPQLMACTLLPRLVADWRRRYPDVEVRLTDTPPEHLLATLHEGEAELAIGPDRGPGSDGEAGEQALERHVLLEDRHWLVCPSDHPLRKRKRVRWNELGPWPFIAPTRDFVRRVLPELQGEGDAAARAILSPPAMEVSYLTTAMGLVAAGLGVTACPTYSESLVRAHGLHMVALEAPAFYREVSIYRLANRAMSPAAASFVENAMDYVRRHPSRGARAPLA